MNWYCPLNLQMIGGYNRFNLQFRTAFVQYIFQIERMEEFWFSHFYPFIIGCIMITINLYSFEPISAGSHIYQNLKSFRKSSFINIITVFIKKKFLFALKIILAIITVIADK